MSRDSEVAPPQSRFDVRIPKAIGRKVVSVVRLVVLAVAGLVALVAALITLDAAMLGDSRRRH